MPGFHRGFATDGVRGGGANGGECAGHTVPRALGADAPSVTDIQKDLLKSGPRNAAGGHYNHCLFWNTLAPAKDSGAPSAALAAAIDKSFGSMDGFKEKFKSTGAGHFAAGWVWLVANRDGGLEIRDTHDEGAILPQDDSVLPMLLCDVWEHAYYLDRQNDRGAYLDAVVNQLLNWDLANSQFEAARTGGEGWKHPE